MSYEQDKRRRHLAVIIAAKGGSNLAAVEDALKAISKAGYRVIDADRIVDLHNVKTVTAEEMKNEEFINYVKHQTALEFGRYLLETNGIEFEEIKTDRGMEIRSTVYALYPRPSHTETRDEKTA